MTHKELMEKIERRGRPQSRNSYKDYRTASAFLSRAERAAESFARRGSKEMTGSVDSSTLKNSPKRNNVVGA